MYSDEIMQAAYQHAMAEWPKEAVGAIVQGAYVPLENVHSNPELFFRVADEVVRDQGETWEALIHSHCQGQLAPSSEDIATQMAFGLPFGIVVLFNAGGEPGLLDTFWFGDEVPMAPLLGRKFRHGVHDCYGAGRDWYREHRGFTIPNYPRDENWWEFGADLIQQNFRDAGFAEVGGEPEEGDAFIMALGSQRPNHCAVYVGNGLIYHHLQGRLSREDPLRPWQRTVVLHLRRKA